LSKSGKEYLNAETCKLYTSSIHNFETFCILHAYPAINIAKLQNLKYPWLIHVLQSDLAEFRRWWIFMQIRQRIFKCFTMQICHLFFRAFWNFL